MIHHISNTDQSPEPASSFLSPLDQLDYMLENTRRGDKGGWSGHRDGIKGTLGNLMEEVAPQPKSINHVPGTQRGLTTCLFGIFEIGAWFGEVWINILFLSIFSKHIIFLQIAIWCYIAAYKRYLGAI